MASETQRQLFLGTTPSRLVRDGPRFPPADQPHDKILQIASSTGELTHPDIRNITAITLGEMAANRLTTYHRERFDASGRAVRPANCAHFVCHMVGVQVEESLMAVAALDSLEGPIVQPEELPRGAIGVIATSGDLQERGFRHFLHAGLSLGDAQWLNVPGFWGELAVSDIGASLTYNRDHILPLYPPLAPDTVHLHHRLTIAL
jgi:hypothetical protein